MPMSDIHFVLIIALIVTGVVRWSNQVESNPSKLLFTPGPLTTTSTVKSALSRDIGSREPEFMSTIYKVRNQLLTLANTTDHEAILIPGSGTYALESVLSSLPCNSKVLVLVNGVYGQRLVDILKRHHVETIVEKVPSGTDFSLTRLDEILSSDVTAVAMVHCETSTGQVNDVKLIGDYLRSKHRPIFIVDAMSSFGALSLDFSNLDFVITSSNKCLQSVPGVSIVFARNTVLEQVERSSRTYSLDLYGFWKSLNTSGQFRFTPPVQVVLALHQALIELERETIPKRLVRYQLLSKTLIEGMTKAGFRTFIESPIITSFLYPHDNWDFNNFYQNLYRRGYVIYPGSLASTQEPSQTFRIGTIGNLNVEDIQRLLHNL